MSSLVCSLKLQTWSLSLQEELQQLSNCFQLQPLMTPVQQSQVQIPQIQEAQFWLSQLKPLRLQKIQLLQLPQLYHSKIVFSLVALGVWTDASILILLVPKLVQYSPQLRKSAAAQSLELPQQLHTSNT